MTRSENRNRLLVAGVLGLVNIALIATLALASISTPANAQGQNKEIIEKPNRSVACPSGWRGARQDQLQVPELAMCSIGS